ncbi:OLC1v1006454C2 [Oldenlandia corymbosa var. corymbosa]|uniref:OLC1v1006454C2 n=1 Tax=Oldenlandia corymbosa var. corymbosa TaxID=529605 RepID=A0AAV1DJQ9_OLDCO|nr:OLC1v1006454C2 [Oldenlandia corymbosa var. corymbosa]
MDLEDLDKPIKLLLHSKSCRQKQYFEQRRLQQLAANAGKASEGMNTYRNHNENNRSLDVLSLLNLSNVAQEPKSTSALASNEPEHEASNYQIVQPLQTFGRFQIHEINPPVASKTNEACSSPSYQPANANTKTSSGRTPLDHIRVSNSDNKKNQLKLVPENQELRMIDILGDEDANINICSGKSLEREAHAAFSIEGLGEVEMETPVHTPVQSPVHSPQGHLSGCRTFLHGRSSPSKAMKPTYSFNLDSELDNIGFELDTMMQEVDVISCKSSIAHSLGSKDRLGSCGKPKQGLFDTEKFSLFKENHNDFNELLGDEELFFHSRKSGKQTWDEKSSSLLHMIVNESAFDLSREDWMNQRDASNDYAFGMNHKNKEFTFEDSHRLSRTPMRRSGNLEAAGAFCSTFSARRDSPAPYLSHQKPDTSLHFRISETARYSPVRSHYDVEDFLDQLKQPYYTYEDARDNTSLLSEESCSSSAVKGVSKKGTFNSKEKQSFGSVDVACSEGFCSEDDMPDWEENCGNWKISHERQNLSRPGICSTSNPLRSKPAQNSYKSPQKRLKPDNSRLFETDFGLGRASSGRDYFRDSESKQPSFCNSKLWIEDPLEASEDIGLHAAGSEFGKFSKFSADCSPCHSFKSEKHDCHLPKLENNILMSSMVDLSEDGNLECRNLKSLHEESCLASEQQSTTRGVDENSDFHTTEHEKCEAEKDTSICRESLSPKNDNSRDASDIEDKCSDCDEFMDGSAEVDCAKHMKCVECAEVASTAAEILDTVDGNQWHVEEIRKVDAQTSLSCQTGVEAKLEEEGIHSKQIKLDGKDKSGVDSRCQVMVPNSYVLQFLCIQVLRKASAMVTEKQI